MLAISNIWLRLFLENPSILNKMPILGQAPRAVLNTFIIKNSRFFLSQQITIYAQGDWFRAWISMGNMIKRSVLYEFL